MACAIAAEEAAVSRRFWAERGVRFEMPSTVERVHCLFVPCRLANFRDLLAAPARIFIEAIRAGRQPLKVTRVRTTDVERRPLA